MEINNRSYFTYEDVYCDENDCLWVFAYDFNGLFTIKEGKVSYVMSVKEYPFESVRLFGAISGIKNKVVLAPTRADSILIWDTQVHEYKNIKIQNIKDDYNKDAKFFSIAKYKECLYLIGHCYPAIIRINPFNDEIEYFFLKEFEGFTDWNGGDIFRKDYVLKDDCLFVPCAFTNKVFIFNFETNKGTFIKVGPDNIKYSGICSDGDLAWLSPIYGNRMIQWKINTDNYEEIELLGNAGRKEDLAYVGCAFFDKNVYVIPAYRNKLIIINPKSKKQEMLVVSEKESTTIAPIRCYYSENNELVVVTSFEGKHFSIVHRNKKYILVNRKIENSLQEVNRIYKENMTDLSDNLEEKIFFDILDFINCIHDVEKRHLMLKNKNTLGQLIYRNI